ncbi:MAG: hypothetical protein ACI9BH_003109, partial [Paracoccaceae bacterium]
YERPPAKGVGWVKTHALFHPLHNRMHDLSSYRA